MERGEPFYVGDGWTGVHLLIRPHSCVLFRHPHILPPAAQLTHLRQMTPHNCVLSDSLVPRMLSTALQKRGTSRTRGTGLLPLKEWIVLIEVTPGGDGRRMERHVLRHVVNTIANASPVALHHPERYAVQVRVAARHPVDALSAVFAEWSAAVDERGAPMGDVVRAEVLTRAEFEHECGSEGLGDGVKGRTHEDGEDRRVVGRFSS
jgi:hypothetical protein